MDFSFLIVRGTKEEKSSKSIRFQQYFVLQPGWKWKVGIGGGFTAHIYSNNIAKIRKVLIIFSCCLGFLWRLHCFILAEFTEKGIRESDKNLFVTVKP